MFLVCNGSHEAIYCLTDFSLIKNGFAMLLTGSTGPSKRGPRRIRGLSGRAGVGKVARGLSGRKSSCDHSNKASVIKDFSVSWG